MWRLIELIVRSGLVIAWRFASWPTRRSPVFVNATTEGVVRDPSAFGMTTGCEPSMTATTELVVPRSMPTVLAMIIFPRSVELPDCRTSYAEDRAHGRGKCQATGLQLRLAAYDKPGGIPHHHTRWVVRVASEI